MKANKVPSLENKLVSLHASFFLIAQLVQSLFFFIYYFFVCVTHCTRTPLHAVGSILVIKFDPQSSGRDNCISSN